jgi:hypothetical protein
MVDLAVVPPAERHGELIANLAPKRGTLGKAQMMRIRGLAATYQTGLLGYKPDVLAVANAPWFGVC